jgi:hypothetical protein
MRDQVVRAAFHRQVLKDEHNKPDTFVIDELGLRNGEIRADIAVVNGKMIGYEIKTAKDTLLRLNNQMVAYNEVFDHVYIITAPNHLEKVINFIPEWWGVYLIDTKDGNACSFILYRKAQLNKCRKTLGLVQLLWKNEVLEILNSIMKCDVKPSVTKEDLYDILSNICASERLSKMVIQYLKMRVGWRKDPILLS